MTTTSAQANVQATVTQLRTLTNRQAAHELLANTSKAQLLAIAEAAGSTTCRRGDAKDSIRNTIVELLVGRSADHDAIMRSLS